MNLASIAVVVLIAAALIDAVMRMKRGGKGCCGDCGGCDGCGAKTQSEQITH